jgi:hypothetical protein
MGFPKAHEKEQAEIVEGRLGSENQTLFLQEN